MQRAVFAPARAVRVLPASLGLAFLTACSLQFGTGVEARDTWTRSYQVKAGVMLEIRETNGLVQIDAADGDAVVVNATRITKASTEEAAKAMLKDFTIAETVTPDQVTLDGNPPGVSLNINTSRRVDYRITVPRETAVTIKSTNSEIRVAGIQGAFRAETTNGEITGTALGNGADVRSVNGTITLDLARLGDTGVRCHLTNGDVTVTVPADARADIDASVVNGDIRADKLNIAFKEQSARKLKGTIGGGGPNVRIEMINGDVRLIGR